MYGNIDGVCIIQTDQGGELARSNSLKEVVTKAEYTIEITGADNSSQNGLAERPHRTLGDMARAGLENAGLHVKYWSDALLHAVFIKNQMPHSALNHKMTPYEKLKGTPPDLSKLTKTNNIKTSTFERFDEAHFSYSEKPPGAKILIEMGMKEIDTNPIIVKPTEDLKILKIQRCNTSPACF